MNKKCIIVFSLAITLVSGGCTSMYHTTYIDEKSQLVNSTAEDSTYTIDTVTFDTDMPIKSFNNEYELVEWAEIKSEKLSTNCSVIVGGKELNVKHTSHLFNDEKFAVLPFFAIMRSLGATVQLEDDGVATIDYDNRQLILYVRYPAIIDKETGKNYLFGIGGNTRSPYFGFVDNEFLIDSSFLSCVLAEIGAILTIDFDKSIIEITIKEPISDETKSTNCRLIVNGIDLSKENFVFLNSAEGWAELPFFAIVEALDGSVQHETDTVSYVYFHEIIYILNMSDNSLRKGQNEENLFEKSSYKYNYGKDSGFYRDIENEFLVDSNSLRYFLAELGYFCEIDFETDTINIRKTKDGSMS